MALAASAGLLLFSARRIINQRLWEAIEQITRYSQQVRAAIEDGVVEPHEREVIDEELHRAITKLQEHTTLVYRVFCAPEK